MKPSLRTRHADLWLGNCLSLLKHIPDSSVNLVATDLPYGTTACEWESIIPLEPLWHELARVAKLNAAFVMTV